MLAWILLHVAVAAAGTWLARRYALRNALLDQPDARRNHVVPTPRGGGAAIVLALLLAVGLWWSRAGSLSPALAAGAAGLLMVALVGWVDDHRPVSPWWRLSVHAVAALLLAAGVVAAGGGLPLAIASALLALGLANVWNFMDGIDGLAASQALLVAAAVAAATSGPAQALAIALAAACAGFLPFNAPRARIFLGDVGSGALGFALAALLAAAMAHGDGGDAIAWLLPPSAFLVDAGLTLVRRMLRGEAWWQPHSQHAYQQWARRARTHLPVTMAYAAWTICACLLALAVEGEGRLHIAFTVVAWYIAGAAAWWWLQRQGRGAHKEHME